MHYYEINGAFNSSLVYASNESEARKLFTKIYNVQPILSVRLVKSWCFQVK